MATQNSAFNALTGVSVGSNANVVIDANSNANFANIDANNYTGSGNLTSSNAHIIGTAVIDGSTDFNPPTSVEYLVIAGGGAGGYSYGGGGGAGGYRTASGLAVSAGTYAVTIGAGGAGSATAGLQTNGGDSVFNGITSTGGGYGGGEGVNNGASGGSGGGGNYSTGTGGAASPAGQGNAGGNSDPSGDYGGGGGGAGQAGYNGNGTYPGQGGDGLASSISGASTYYAGGGGGWYRYGTTSGGLGGGGGGRYSTNGVSGTVNTGGGGGSTSGVDVGVYSSGSGGSGVVIIRYSDTYSPAASYTGATYTVAGGYRIYVFTTSGSITFGGAVNSTSPTTGTLIVGGGVGIANDVFIGGNITSSSLVNFSSASNIALGNVSNLHITGGTDGYVLSTDGTGNLNWSAAASSLNVSQYTTGSISNTIGNVSNLLFDTTTGFNVTSLGANTALISLGSSFKTWQVAGQTSLVAVGEDTVEFVDGNNIVITTNAAARPQQIEFSLSENVSITGNLIVGNANLGNAATANFFVGDGGLLTNIYVAGGTAINNGNSNVAVSANGNVTTAVAGNANVIVVTGTGMNVAGTLNTTGNASVGNLNIGTGVSGSLTGANVISANYFIGNGALLTGITATSNILINGNSNVYVSPNGNVTTSVGGNPNVFVVSNTGVNINGTALIAGNLTVNGNISYINVEQLYVTDPIIEMGGSANGAPLVVNDGKDRGTLLHYYTTTPVDAFMGWDNSNSEFIFGSNVTDASDVITVNEYGNVRANFFIGDGSTLANITAANITGTVANANYALYANTAYSVDVANVVGIGNIATLNLDGSSSNILYGNGIFAPGASTSGISNGTSNVNISTANGNVVTTANGNTILTITDIGANINGYANATYFVGDGGNISNITAGNITGEVANANYATYAGTAYSVSGANVSGEVANANYATYAGTAYSVSGSNVSGEVANANYALYANTAYSVDVANVVGIGNIATLNLDGSSSNILYGNGIFAPGGGTIPGSVNPPASPAEGDFWYDTELNILARYTLSGGQYYWLDITGQTILNVAADPNILNPLLFPPDLFPELSPFLLMAATT